MKTYLLPFYLFCAFMAAMFSCSEKKEVDKELVITGRGKIESLSFINSSPISFDRGLGLIVLDENGTRYRMTLNKASVKATGTTYFESIDFIGPKTRLASQEQYLVDLTGLTTPNSLVISMYPEMEVNSTTKFKLDFTTETEFGVSVEDEAALKSYRENVQTKFKALVNDVLENNWAKDINGAEDGDQHQRVTVSVNPY